MKTKKRSQVTVEQVYAIKKKLFSLQYKRAQIVKQTTPLKVMLREFIQQHMEEVETYIVSHRREHSILGWAVDKIKRGYFGIDTNLQKLLDVIQSLENAKLLDVNRKGVTMKNFF